MKFSLVENDKSTVWDEVILACMILVSMAVGIFLIVVRPEFWVITSAHTCLAGVLLTLFGVMFIPSLFYRLTHNDKK